MSDVVQERSRPWRFAAFLTFVAAGTAGQFAVALRFLFVAIACVLFIIDFWLDQDNGLITRDGDPHIFWFTIAFFSVLTLLLLWMVLMDMGLVQ